MQTETRSDTHTEVSLAGKRVALARGAEEAHTPAEALHALGAELVFYPVLERLPPADLSALDQALDQALAGHYTWLLLPSASAVLALAERLDLRQIAPARLTQALRLALFGTTTHLAAQAALGVAPLPDAASHVELARWMQPQPDERVLLLQAAGARSDWAHLLAPAPVVSVAAYRAQMGQGGDALPALLWAGVVDAVVFTSEANVRYFARRLAAEGGSLAMLDHVCVACLEPPTAQAAQALGLRVQVVPAEHSPHALALALARCLAE